MAKLLNPLAPSGDMPAKDDPDVDPDAAVENNQYPERTDLSDATRTKGH
jgi:hypothetical protein